MSIDKTLNVYQRRVFDSMNYISERVSGSVSLEEIADIAHFSKFHFHRIFKVFTGETVADFTRRVRLEKAANFLCYDHYKGVTEIAFECGFSSSQNFAKQFNRYFGVSPSRFRKDALDADLSEYLADKKAGFSGDKLYVPCTHYYQSMDVTITQQPAFKLLYLRLIGTYESKQTYEGIKALLDILSKHNFEATKLIGIAWDNPDITEGQKCRYDIGVTVEPDTEIPEGLAIQEIAGGEFAHYRCEITDGDLDKPWEDLFSTWLPYSGYMPSGAPGYELFHQYNTEDLNDTWRIEVCIPVSQL